MMNLLPLRDIHLPPAIGWWPPPPGWWLVLAGLVVLMVFVVYYRRRRRPAVPVRRMARRELDALWNDLRLPPAEKVRQLSILVRRIALSVYPREEVAGLSGQEWLVWLERPLSDGRFVDGPGRLLGELPYRSSHAEDASSLDALFSLCRDWLDRLPPRQR